jgi:hypothetical protein
LTSKDGFSNAGVLFENKFLHSQNLSSIVVLERKLSRVDYLDREIIIGRNNLWRTRMMKDEMLC